MQTLLVNGQSTNHDPVQNDSSEFLLGVTVADVTTNIEKINKEMAQDSKKKKEVPKEFDEKIRKSLGWNPNDPDRKKNKPPKKK